jgi:large subunit ribosomal protein L25
MEQIELQAATREILGKKVRFLRRQGVIPVHLFGHGVESLALQSETAQLQRVLAEAGKTKIISLKLDKDKKPRNVVIRETQRNPLTGELLHVDFYQVRMTEKIQVEIPIVLVGEAPALKSRDNMLAQELYSLTIESLPDKIPPSVELDVSSLAEAEQAIYVRDITLDEGVTVLSDPEHMVVKITPRPIEKMEEVVEEEVLEEEAIEAPEEAPPVKEEEKEAQE